MSEIDKNQKINILNNLLYSINSSIYQTQQELNMELSVENPNPNIVDGYNQQLLDLSEKSSYLNSELNGLING